MRKPALIVAVALACAVIPSACSASSSAQKARGHHHHHHGHHHRGHKPPKHFFGVVTPRAVEGKDARLMHRNGVSIAHFGLLWPYVQPGSSNQHVWHWVDNIVGPLAAKGIRAVPFVWGSPHWVAPEQRDSPLNSKKGKQAWTDFLRAAVQRYGPDGTYWTAPGLYQSQFPGAKPKPIEAWQIWNEPTLDKFLPKKHYVKRYAKLVKVSHKVIKSEDRHAKTILAGVPGNQHPSPQKFLKRFYKVNRIKRAFDGVALHPYSKNTKQLKRSVKKIRKAMRKGHDPRTGLWLTEMGWGSGHRNHFGLNKGVKGQKKLLKKSFKLILDHRKSWRIENLFWFDWRDPPPGHHDCSFCGSAGLLKYNFKPKPALKAYRHFAKHHRR